MPTFRRNQVFAIALSACVLSLSASLAACGDRKDSVGPGTESFSPGNGSHTMGVGSTSTPLGRATFVDPKDQNIHVKRISGDWHMEIKSKPAFDIAIQNIVFQPGGQSGWHRHPGPVFIQVVSGTMTFYESDDPTCTPIVRTAGQGYLDLGEHAHIARNESGSPAQNVVTYFAPPGAALRIDAPAPGNCSF
ncbi:MAG: cupin domain-containing protein [Gemmatimonadaceae bacterium]